MNLKFKSPNVATTNLLEEQSRGTKHSLVTYNPDAGKDLRAGGEGDDRG